MYMWSMPYTKYDQLRSRIRDATQIGQNQTANLRNKQKILEQKR